MEKPAEELARKVGHYGWLMVAGVVAVFDYIADESMSAAFRRGLENDRTRPLVLGAFALTGAHLCDIIPHEPVELDPFRYLSRLKRTSS